MLPQRQIFGVFHTPVLRHLRTFFVRIKNMDDAEVAWVEFELHWRSLEPSSQRSEGWRIVEKLHELDAVVVDDLFFDLAQQDLQVFSICGTRGLKPSLTACSQRLAGTPLRPR